MKLPPAWITLSLTAGVSFGASWLLARRNAPDSGGRSAVVSAIAQSAQKREERGRAAQKETPSAVPSPGGVMYDAGLREALAMPDLAAAIKHIMDHESDDHCADTRLICLVEQLPAGRMGELSAALQAHMGNDFVVRFVLSTWAQRDSGAAQVWVQAHPGLNAAGLRYFVSGMVRASPENALAWLDARPLSAASIGLRTAVVDAMAETHPAAALALMKSRGWVANSPGALIKLMHNWGGADPQTALEGLRSVLAESGTAPLKDYPSGNGGTARHADQTFSILLRSLLNGAYDRSPSEAAALLSSLTPDEYTAGKSAFASEVLARDPAVGEVFFTAHPDEKTRPMLLSLTQENPALALRLLGRIEDAALQQELLRTAVMGFGGRDPVVVAPEGQATVAAVLAAMPDEKERGRATSRLCQDNAAASPQWAMEMWRKLPLDAQLTYGQGYFQGLAKADPDLALSEFRRSEPDMQTSALQILCMNLAGTRPAEALDLVMQSSVPAAQSASAATLFAFWAQSDPAAALTALESHASQLNLEAISRNLAKAGQSRYGGGLEYRPVATDELADRLQKLIGASTSHSAPP